MSHTPGPWQAIGSIPSDGFDCFWINAQPSPALRGFTKNIASINGPQSDPECEDNARLIAASPDLLVALKEALSCLEIEVKMRTPQWDGHAAYYSGIGKARLAIAKAEGAS